VRLVAVLGYSDRRESGLHPVCAARLERAAEVSQPGDTVLLSGWSRTGDSSTEAELMAHAWRGSCSRILLDRGARTTTGNAIGIARAARSLGASEVVVVTSSWHGRRASALVAAALARTRPHLELVTADDRPPAATRLRELACWSAVPVLAAVAARAG